jgi:hypothetical protein
MTDNHSIPLEFYPTEVRTKSSISRFSNRTLRTSHLVSPGCRSEMATLADKEYVDDPETCEGLPAHVQIVGKPMMDEELIEIMKVVEQILKQNK